MSKMFDDFKALMLKVIAFEANKIGGERRGSGRQALVHVALVQFRSGRRRMKNGKKLFVYFGDAFRTSWSSSSTDATTNESLR